MRDTFVMYTKYLENIKLLSMEQRGILFTALMQYASGYDIPDLPDMDGMTSMAFSFIRSQMDRDNEKYKEVCRKRSEAGKIGGRPKEESKAKGLEEKQEKAKKANAFFDKQNNPDNDHDYDSDHDNDHKKNIYSHRFEEVWSAYPRKKEKAAAYKAYNARLKEGIPEDELLLAVKRYAQDCKTMGTEEQYIKHGATFFGVNKPFMDYLAEDYKPAVLETKKKPVQSNRFHNFKEHDYDYDDLMKQAILGGRT